ncbi:MAG: protein-glutamate methylesterase/protein-glutamine glutaminase [Armatimonadota bacterium]
MPESPIRILIVDDSAFIRRALTKLIEAGRGMRVVGTAGNGAEALEAIKNLRPDLVTLDIEMPVMDGITALEKIMRRFPLPVVMLSSGTSSSAELTMRCLEMGAVDFVAKPAGDENLDSIRYIIWQKLRSAAGAHLAQSPFPFRRAAARLRSAIPPARAQRVVAIGSSTGGPRVLLEILQALPASLSAGVLIVQHMPPNFTEAMARRFNDNCAIAVFEAREGDLVTAGTAMVAPGGVHLGLTPQKEVRLLETPPIWGVRPAVDVMMADVAACYGPAALGVILTGMGRDGAQGLLQIRQAGGATLAQDEASCTVYGMPRAAVENGAAERVLPPAEIAAAIIAWCESTAVAPAATA